MERYGRGQEGGNRIRPWRGAVQEPRPDLKGAARAGVEEYPERMGCPVCQYYLRIGSCKFGASCKYHHPRQGAGTVSPVSLNYYGYPLCPGEKECSYYVKTGQCKFGATCKFHHPQPANIQVQAPAVPAQVAPEPSQVPQPAIYQSVLYPSVPSSQQYEVSPVGIPSTQPTVGSGSVYGVAQLSPSIPGYTGPYQPLPSSTGPSSSSQKEYPLTERSGQPECQYFMKTGTVNLDPCVDTIIHWNWLRKAHLLFLAPWISLYVRIAAWIKSGYGKDSSLTRMSSSLSTSSGSVGSVFSASIPYSSMQQSSQSSGHAAGSSVEGTP
ncbi:hypothetical protein HS088_TW13G01589 [Tripterygium wilfordii]|uniref:C3H1-type domain-containing protein n=1 Tax=Tripterygium wilfordii TaxID=458696 RepID=A0A7J7CXF6_TRIWF|nr:hypothetical protein HS088_TW13G01589 [Tripterygium wilfordii]